MGEKITEDIIANCHQCNTPADTHTNCKNQCCHILFIQCKACNKKLNGCCSKKCAEFILLPGKKQKELFKTNKIQFTAQKTKNIKPKLTEFNN